MLHKQPENACVIFNSVPNYKLHKTNEPYHFPIISIFDIVRAQFKLLDHLVITKLFLSVGSNMGGMQSIVTAWLEPQRVQRVIVEVLAKEEEEDDDSGVGDGVVVGDNGDDNLPGQQRRSITTCMIDPTNAARVVTVAIKDI
ncbi:hypothetical protein BY996DRAFT_6413932 [Phakopsora pachyrhizi]|nr:hypothetical protein BY996DRAFT_6413932 [Phakopsora pachyrhizi]